MMNLKSICWMALAVAATGCFATQAHADETQKITEAMNRAVFQDSGNFYENTGIGRQASLLFGLSFPDHESVNDAYAVHKMSQDLSSQRAGTPVVTADLPNPYNSSLLTNPPRIR